MNEFRIRFEPTIKQFEALQYLMDQQTKVVWYWGAAGWGKTILAVMWLIIMCLKYPWVRYWVFRRYIQDAKDTTLPSIQKAFYLLWLQQDEHYYIKDNNKLIEFPNWSTIIIRGLQEKPSDIHFTKLWSLELTGAFVEEANECPAQGMEVLKGRLGRWQNLEMNIPIKMLCCFNPDKWYVYNMFYKPFKEGKETKGVKFIPALPTDNPHLGEDYKDTIRGYKHTNKILYERLWLWNFDYDDSPWRIFDYDKLLDMKTNPNYSWDYYITSDVAGEWKDKSVILVWNWFKVIDYRIITKNKVDENFLKQYRTLAHKYWIGMSSVVADKTWIWEWVVGMLGCKGFVSNASPIQDREYEMDKTQKQNYNNIRSQCYFKLAEAVEKNKINLSILDGALFSQLVEELDVTVEVDFDKETPRKIIPKEKLKEKTWRSPDLADAVMMRMFFELKPKTNVWFFDLS